jgi:hypothetical protein
VSHAYVRHDHPVHAELEHALSLDFVNADRLVDTRVAVEFTRESARELAEHLLRTLDAVDAYKDA